MKVIRNYFYNAGYQLLAMILPLVTAPYISRTLSPSGVGINAYTNSIIQYFVLFGSIGISIYGNRQIAYMNGNKEKISKTFWEIQAVKTLAILVAYFGFAIYMQVGVRYPKYMMIQSLNLVGALLDISWLYMGLEDFKKTVIRNTLVKILSVILIFSLVKDRDDIGIYIFILAFSLILGNLTLWPSLKNILVKVKIRNLRPLPHIKPAVALFIPQIATQLYLQLNKTMLGSMVSPDSSGFYFNTDQLVKVILSIVTATGTVMLPHVSSAFSSGNNDKVNRYLYSSFDFVSFLAIAMTFGLAGVGMHLGPYFYGKGFGPVGMATVIESVVITLIGWSNAIGVQFLLPTNRVRPYTTSVMLGAISNIILNVPLIHFGGLNGAMYSTVIAELIVTAYQVWAIKDVVNLKEMFSSVPKYLFAGVIMFIPVFKINTSVRTSMISLAIEVVVGIVIYFAMIFILRPKILYTGKNLLKNLKNKNKSED